MNDKFKTDIPPFSYQPGSGDRPRFYYFPESPAPLFSQKYGDVPEDPIRRHVDIGKIHFEKIQSEISRVAKVEGVLVGLPGRWGPAMVVDEYQQICFGEKRLTTGGRGSQSHRGYLMIEPEKLFDSIERLNFVGEQRLRQGQSLEYKWVLPEVNLPTRRIASLRDTHPLA